MRKAGDLLSAIIDEKMRQQAQGYSKLFYSWARITAKHGIAAAADHSRIRELERNVLLVEADHPGWIQLLQLKCHKLLADLQAQFPDLALTGISFRLSRNPAAGTEAPPEASGGEDGDAAGAFGTAEPPAAGYAAFAETDPQSRPAAGKNAYEQISDERLRNTLKSLERSVKGRRARD
jgi:hypothetical protein